MGISSLDEATKARLQRVADLMLDIYQTRAEMRYIDAAAIKPGPHDITHLMPLYQSLKLDPTVIYLYSILPYVDEVEAGQREFYMGGTWLNHLDKEQVQQGRDPFFLSPEGNDFSDPKGPYMRPWFTPLSVLCERQQVIIYDAKEDRIWTIDQGSWKNEDPALRDAAEREDSPFEDEYDDDDDMDSEDGGDFVVVPNDISRMPARAAAEVLRDINAWFRAHRVPFPGNPDWSDGDGFDTTLTELYARHGWPDHFDGDAFEVGRLRRWAVARVRDDQGEPARKLEEAQEDVDRCREQLKHYEKATATSKSTKGKWRGKFDALRASLELQRSLMEMEEVEADMARRDQGPSGGGDVRIKECRVLMRRLKDRQGALGTNNQAMVMNKATVRWIRAERRQGEKEAANLVKAVEAAKADVERLFPGVEVDLDAPYDEPSGLETAERDHASTEKLIASLESDIATYQEWQATVPRLQRDLIRSVKDEIDKTKTVIERLRGENEGLRDEIERLAYRKDMRG
ncbi:hypothetical protein PG997_002717 [Apiospora hydei]|uniref:Uncharacterized protein n=1 Tax=Apiospora hydei TaxID=1337664 RepID=A0ABR1WX65_9PEZI